VTTVEQSQQTISNSLSSVQSNDLDQSILGIGDSPALIGSSGSMLTDQQRLEEERRKETERKIQVSNCFSSLMIQTNKLEVYTWQAFPSYS